MTNKLFFKAICNTIIALLLLSGCKNSIDNGLVTSVYMRDKFNQTADNFVQGDAINMTLSIKNDSTSDKTLNFPSSQQYEFIIKDSASNEIWRWSTGLAFTQVASAFSLGPTDTRSTTYTWNQFTDTNNTTLIPIGSYTLEAYFVGNGPVAQTTLTIQ